MSEGLDEELEEDLDRRVRRLIERKEFEEATRLLSLLARDAIQHDAPYTAEHIARLHHETLQAREDLLDDALARYEANGWWVFNRGQFEATIKRSDKMSKRRVLLDTLAALLTLGISLVITFARQDARQQVLRIRIDSHGNIEQQADALPLLESGDFHH